MRSEVLLEGGKARSLYSKGQVGSKTEKDLYPQLLREKRGTTRRGASEMGVF